MSSLDKDARGAYWRSLEAYEAALDDRPEVRRFVESEFPEQAGDLFDPVSRRRFMQLMGASLALAGVAGPGCKRWEREEIVPLSRRPDGLIPGVPRYFATAMELGGVADGLVATSFDGRPVKVDGNDKHPFGGRASTSFAQASVLDLYDPDRSFGVRRQRTAGNWDDFETFVRERILPADGSGLRVLAEASSSPTLAALRQRFLAKYPQARWYEYEPLSLDNERLGLEQAAGEALRAVARLDRAARIVTLDADLFHMHPARLRYARDYAARRQPDRLGESSAAMNRLYAVESTFTTTGVMADHRLPMPSSRIVDLVRAMEAAVTDGAADAALSESERRFLDAVAKDLKDNNGQSVVIAGHRQPPEVHARVARINEALGANGRTVEYVRLPDGGRPSHAEAVRSLASDMQANRVQTLLILGGNPVYNAPADIDFARGLQGVETSIHLSDRYDETSAACTWHLPRSHYLESWGDARTYDGTYTLIQPLIAPMWLDEQGRGSKTPIELVAMLLGRSDSNGRALVRETFAVLFGSGPGDAVWRRALHDGFVRGSGYLVARNVSLRQVAAATPAPALTKDSLELVFIPSPHTFDGRFANNGWLQETPDFITKLTWDNAALINPNTAAELGVKTGDLIKIIAHNRDIEAPVYTLPGQARNSIALAVGHGRTRAGRVGGHSDEGVGAQGFNAYPLRNSDTLSIATGVRVQGTSSRYALASTQDHWDLGDRTGRAGIEQRLDDIIREADAEEHKANPYAVSHSEHDVEMPSFVPAANGKSLWREHDYSGPRPGTPAETPRYKWGMAIDLDKCTGCNSCMVACQAENNVPIVGKEQVQKNREMHWIRIDRYFAGDNLRDNPRIAHQLVTCQQCENAACEQVCPVGATIHSEEGLNDMVYNRCVGTRYCLNNCPYKVRRFNFLDYINGADVPGGALSDARNRVRQLLFNPEVTVRSRGVMEKCTYCVQRIVNKRIAAKNERRQLTDGEVLTACQQACPTEAIVFGDLNDAGSKVSAAHKKPRAYELLTGLNPRARNRFLARIRNPNPELG